MQYLQKGVQKSFQALYHHKPLGAVLLVLQLGFILSFLYITINYEVKIIQDAQSIIQPLQQANYDAESIQQGQYFLPDFAGIYSSYQSLLQNIFYLGLWLAGLFLVLNGGIWLLTHSLLASSKPTWKTILHGWLKYLVAAVFFIGIPLLIGYIGLKIILARQVDVDMFTSLLNSIPYILGVLYYLLLVALTFITDPSWSQFVKHFYRAGLRKIHRTLLVLVINGALIAGSLYLVYLSMNYEGQFWLVVLASIIAVFIIVLSRLFWIACLQELVHEKSHH